jgi:signal transduction histidine kinase
MTQRSLRLRLFFAGAFAVVVALMLAGAGLLLLFERHLERSYDDDLDAYVRHIARRLDAAKDGGTPPASAFASDPRFETPLSGFYWQVDVGGVVTLRSLSLAEFALAPPGDCIADGVTRYYRLAGPPRQALLVGEACRLRDGVKTRILAGVDRASLSQARDQFAVELVVGLFLLATVLAVAMWAQVGLGLSPLAGLGAEVAEIARGRRERLSTDGPTELRPLVDELNGLLDEREKEIARARNRAADFAHGMKTPLTALAADIRQLRAQGVVDIARSLESLGKEMHRTVERELARARTAHRAGKGAGAPVAEIAAALARTLDRAGTGVAFEIACAPACMLPLDRDDLMEILGNLMENASRYATTRIRVSAGRDARGARLLVEDDGPGMPESDEARARLRGGRLDRSGGAGLGLAIVQDVLDAYGLSMSFSRSSLGGLAVMIDMPLNMKSGAATERGAPGAQV